MKLNKLVVRRLPGIPDGFVLQNSALLTLIIGPNGSGKSSLCRAVHSLLWSEKKVIPPFSVEAVFDQEQTPYKAVREDGFSTRWFRQGEPIPAPALPGNHLARCYEMGILDLVLPAGGEVEKQLAATINREMSGGVNLVLIAENLFSEKSRLPKQQQKELNRATNHRNSLLRHQNQLFLKETQLVDKREELAIAEDSAQTLSLLEDLEKRNQVAEKLAEAKALAETFAPGQNQVNPDDAKTLKTLLKRRKEKQKTTQQIRQENETLLVEMDSLACPCDDTKLGLLQRQVTKATELTAELKSIEEKLIGQQKVLKESLHSLDPDTDDDAAGPEPGRTVYSELFKAYSQVVKFQGQDAGLQALQDNLDSIDLQDTTLGAATLEELRQWLANPQPTSLLFPGVILFLGLATVILGWFLEYRFLIPGLAILGLGLWQTIRNGKQKRDYWQSTRQLVQQLRQDGLQVADNLGPAEALALLVRENRSFSGQQTRQNLRKSLARKQKDLSAATNPVDADLLALKREHGLALDRETPELINLMNAVPYYRETKAEILRLKAIRDSQQQTQNSLLETIGTGFTAAGFEPPATTLEAQNLLEILETRLGNFQDLQKTQQQNQKDLERLTLDLEDLDQDLSLFRKRLQITPDDEQEQVRQLVLGHPDWLEVQKRITGLEHEFNDLDQRFRKDPRLLDPQSAESWAPELIAQKIGALGAKARTAWDLREEINRIEFDVDQARKNLQVAEAQDQVQSARMALRETRQLHRENALGRLMLNDVEKAYHHDSRPRVLAKASDFFLDFTQGVYKLRVVPGPDRNGRFAAFDTGLSQNVELGALSDGTRAQLLLAVRLAFITEHESSLKPPIFLDESLATSDPERFAAIAKNLGQWAERYQRQIFYLSCNPADAEAWKRAHQESRLLTPEVVDLALVRDLGQRGIPTFEQELPPGYPPPGDLTPAEYAKELHVPHLEPWYPGTRTHLWYLLADNLPLLHRLLQAAAPTLGRWLARKGALTALAEMSSEEIAKLEARGRCLDSFFKNWQIGRGRPLTSSDLLESGHIGDSFLEKCRALLVDVNGDAENFLVQLRAKKVPRFQTRNIQLLEDYFWGKGFLDTRVVLAEEELLGQVLSTMAQEIQAGKLTVPEVRNLVLTWGLFLKDQVQSLD